MGIERLQHAGNRAVDHAVGLDVADVHVFNGLQASSEDLVLLGDLILGGKRRSSEIRACAGAQRKDNGGRRKGSESRHAVMLRMKFGLLIESEGSKTRRQAGQ